MYLMIRQNTQLDYDKWGGKVILSKTDITFVRKLNQRKRQIIAWTSMLRPLFYSYIILIIKRKFKEEVYC